MIVYLSIKCNDITNIAYYMNRDMLEITLDIGYSHIVFYLNDDWILFGFNDKCIMTEKFKNHFSNYAFDDNHITTKCKYYTIFKFIGLKIYYNILLI